MNNIKYILYKTNRKTISLSINSKGELIVRAPKYVSNKYINEFIESKRVWIAKHKARVQEQESYEKVYQDGEVFMILGDEYILKIQDNSRKIFISDKSILFPRKYLDNSKKHMMDFYKSITRDYIINRANHLGHSLKLHAKNYRITSAEKRWGSCTSHGTINFSYRLIMAEPFAIDYVIIHELMHLVHMDHSKKFYKILEKSYPDYKQAKKYLKDNNIKMRI